MSLPRQHTPYDEHRNSSQVFPVPPNALPDARRALAAFERDYPELYSWICEGHPGMTEDEHRIRFGEPYQARKRGKRAD